MHQRCAIGRAAVRACVRRCGGAVRAARFFSCAKFGALCETSVAPCTLSPHRAQTASRRRCTRFPCSLWCVLPPAFAARARAASILRYASRPSGGSPDAPRADRCGAYCDHTRAPARPLARKQHLPGVCSLLPRRARDPARAVLASVDQRSETARARAARRAQAHLRTRRAGFLAPASWQNLRKVCSCFSRGARARRVAPPRGTLLRVGQRSETAQLRAYATVRDPTCAPSSPDSYHSSPAHLPARPPARAVLAPSAFQTICRPGLALSLWT